MEFVIWLIVGLLVGGGIGALATWWISRARGGAVSVMQLKQENDRFRNEVTEHFVETAHLINQMTDSYKQVFDHLSSGAEKLVDNKSLAERLPPVSGQEVKLSQFGASTSAETTERSAPDSKSAAKNAGAAQESGRAKAAEKPAERPDPLKDKSKSAAGASTQASGKTENGSPTGSGKAGHDGKSAGSSSSTEGKVSASSTQSTEKSSSKD